VLTKQLKRHIFPLSRFTSTLPVQVEIEGLTGDIKFNDDGRRVNYTLHVVEMTVNSAMVSNRIWCGRGHRKKGQRKAEKTGKWQPQIVAQLEPSNRYHTP